MSNLRQSVESVLEALKRANNTAMINSIKARIPECGDFAAIAQDLDWAIETLCIAMVEPNQCQHGVIDGNCKECYMIESNHKQANRIAELETLKDYKHSV